MHGLHANSAGLLSLKPAELSSHMRGDSWHASAAEHVLVGLSKGWCGRLLVAALYQVETASASAPGSWPLPDNSRQAPPAVLSAVVLVCCARPPDGCCLGDSHCWAKRWGAAACNFETRGTETGLPRGEEEAAQQCWCGQPWRPREASGSPT